MSVLVAYASRHGATQGIAERIAQQLQAAGLQAEARPAKEARDLGAYDAFVIGSAVYLFHWMKEATELVRRNRTFLAGRPVWLFSCGPLGTETTDAEGHDLLDESELKEIAELRAAVRPRDHRVFFGAFDRHTKAVGFTERFVLMMPAARAMFPEGDFRDWTAIEAWADSIAQELAPVPASRR